ncbi:hypothetical protein YC2023_071686 [Brassica napus]
MTACCGTINSTALPLSPLLRKQLHLDLQHSVSSSSGLSPSTLLVFLCSITDCSGLAHMNMHGLHENPSWEKDHTIAPLESPHCSTTLEHTLTTLNLHIDDSEPLHTRC